jgi:opacity protein-like surface antigen
MKKSLLMFIAIFIAGSMSAQFYAGVKLGYGFGAQKSDIGSTVTNTSTANIWGSLGQGFTPGLKLGYFFNDNLGVEMQINYFMGAKLTVADVDMTGYTNLTTAQSSQLRLIPALVYKTDMGVYGRFGMVIPASGKTIIEKEEVSMATGTSVTTNVTQEFHGSFAMGFAGAFGYEFELSDNLKLFGELEYIGLSIKGKTSEVTTYTVNGADQLPAMTSYQKEANYVDELNASSNNGSYNTSPDMAKAKDVLRSSAGYSSFRINFGISMYF